MTKGILENKTLSIMQMIYVLVFCFTMVIPATSFVSIKLLAENQIITVDEKSKLIKHLEIQPQKALDEQKIDLLQKSFNDLIMKSLEDQIKKLDKLQTDFTIHQTHI